MGDTGAVEPTGPDALDERDALLVRELFARFAGLWEALAADEWERAREFLAPDFRHRIDKQLNFADLDVDEFFANFRIWKELAGSIEEDVGDVLAVTDDAMVYHRDVHAVSANGLETTWSALVVAVARDDKLTHLEEYEPEDVARAMARFDELTQ